MGVFSYLNIKRPASLLWRAFSPGRDAQPDNDENTPDNKIEDVVAAIDAENADKNLAIEAEDVNKTIDILVSADCDHDQNRKISESSTSSGVSDMSQNSSIESSSKATPDTSLSLYTTELLSKPELLPESVSHRSNSLQGSLLSYTSSRSNSISSCTRAPMVYKEFPSARLRENSTKSGGSRPNSALLSVLSAHFDAFKGRISRNKF